MDMKGVIINYRGSHKTMKPNQIIVSPDGITSREEARRLVGKRVVYGGKVMGVITAPHGNKGCVRVRFDRGICVTLWSHLKG